MVTVALDSLPDEMLQHVITAFTLTACTNNATSTDDGIPAFEELKGLGCVSKGMLQQLHRLRPLVGVLNLAVVQRPAHGPWRPMLLYKGELTEAVVEQARQGRVCSIRAVQPFSRLPGSENSPPYGNHSLTRVVARRVVPELLGADCSLLHLDMSDGVAGCVRLDGTWTARFGKKVLCSAVLRRLMLEQCGLQGPLPELRLPALQVLQLPYNKLTGGLEPLQSCTALRYLDVGHNKLTGGLEPLRGCTALETLWVGYNRQLTGGLEPLRACAALKELFWSKTRLKPTREDKAHFKRQCEIF